VRRISVASSRLGGFDITTDVERLQVELPDKRATTLFELDFDHSFKERGQESVTSSLTLSL
jgi:hypothetical protein